MGESIRSLSPAAKQVILAFEIREAALPESVLRVHAPSGYAAAGLQCRTSSLELFFGILFRFSGPLLKTAHGYASSGRRSEYTYF